YDADCGLPTEDARAASEEYAIASAAAQAARRFERSPEHAGKARGKCLLRGGISAAPRPQVRGLPVQGLPGCALGVHSDVPRSAVCGDGLGTGRAASTLRGAEQPQGNVGPCAARSAPGLRTGSLDLRWVGSDLSEP